MTTTCEYTRISLSVPYFNQVQRHCAHRNHKLKSNVYLVNFSLLYLLMVACYNSNTLIVKSFLEMCFGILLLYRKLNVCICCANIDDVSDTLESNFLEHYYFCSHQNDVRPLYFVLHKLYIVFYDV